MLLIFHAALLAQQCTTPPGKNATDRPGGDLSSDPAPTIEACAARCCRVLDCVGYVFAAKAPGDFGHCRSGVSCCYLKSSLTAPRPATCCAAGAVHRRATGANVSIDASRALARTSPALVSFNLDWHLNSEEPPAWSHNASAMTIDLQSPRLHAAVSAMAPAHLRVGGSEGDKIVYDVAGDGCGPSSGAPQPVEAAFCLSMARWRELVAFAAATGVRLVFGLNAMSLRANATAPLDLRNIDAFLNYTAANGLHVYGFELGNELPRVPPAVCAHDFRRLAALLVRRPLHGERAVSAKGHPADALAEPPRVELRQLRQRSIVAHAHAEVQLDELRLGELRTLGVRARQAQRGLGQRLAALRTHQQPRPAQQRVKVHAHLGPADPLQHHLGG